MTVLPHQLRVIDERTELAAKLFKLNEFIKSTTFASLDSTEQGRLKLQSMLMTSYCQVLQERIAAF